MRRKNFLQKIPIMWLIVFTFVPVVICTMIIMVAIFLKMSYSQIIESSKNNMLNTLTQSVGVMDSRMSDILERMQYIENSSELTSLAMTMSKEEKEGSLADYYILLRQKIDNQFVTSGSYLDSVIIDFNDGAFRLYKKDDIFNNICFQCEDWNTQNTGVYQWKFLHDDTIFPKCGIEGENSQKVFSLYRLYGREGENGQGAIVFNIKEDIFQDVLDILKNEENSYMTLIDDGQYLCYKQIESNYQISEETLRYLQEEEDKPSGVLIKSITGEEIMAYTRHLKSNDWVVVAFIPVNTMFYEVTNMKQAMQLAAFISILVSVALCIVLSKLIVLPINRLSKVVSVDDVTTIQELHAGGTKEIKVLGDTLNDLIHRVKELIGIIRKEQEEKRNTELSLLQEQINPHFLYNTLYSVQQLCELDEPQEAGKMVEALAGFFRTGLSRGEDVIPITTEISHVKSYLFIQHMKYGDKFEYEILMEEEISQYKILKLTLQPLVENALIHGIQKQRGTGKITISVERENDNIMLRVEDTGAGMNENRLTNVVKSMHQESGYQDISFGVRNVYTRMMIYYKGQATMDIKSKQGVGTKVTICIPISQMEV